MKRIHIVSEHYKLQVVQSFTLSLILVVKALMMFLQLVFYRRRKSYLLNVIRRIDILLVREYFTVLTNGSAFKHYPAIYTADQTISSLQSL